MPLEIDKLLDLIKVDENKKPLRDAPQKNKRENVGILKKQGGVYPNPTSFVI